MTHAQIRLVRSLADKRAREETGLFVAEGAKLVGELLGSHLKVRSLFTLEGVLEGRADAQVVTPSEMERLSLLKTPSKALALVEIPRYSFDAQRAASELVLALDDVQNPGNLGTIIRLADWFGIGDIVCSPATADCFNPKVVQATMGAILRVRVHYLDLDRVLPQLDSGTPVYGTFLDGGSLYGERLTANGFIVMGNEGKGICPAAERHITRRISIPSYPADRSGSESLNVAVATAVVCAEFRRQSTSIG